MVILGVWRFKIMFLWSLNERRMNTSENDNFEHACDIIIFWITIIFKKIYKTYFKCQLYHSIQFLGEYIIQSVII